MVSHVEKFPKSKKWSQYTDFISNPEDYPKSGVDAANVGPEFTILGYDGLSELCAIENKLYKEYFI